MCLVDLVTVTELGLVRKGTGQVPCEMIMFLKLAHILFFDSFLRFSYSVRHSSVLSSHVLVPPRVSVPAEWMEKKAGVGPCCHPFLLFRSRRWTGNCTGCWELLPRLALSGCGILPNLSQHRPAMEQHPQDPSSQPR